MKLKIFTMLIILGLLSATPLIYMGRFDPLALFDRGMDTGMAGFTALKGKAPENLTSVVTDEKVQVYQWRDTNGVMQYSNTPPMGMPAKQVTLDPGSNLIRATRVPPEETGVSQPATGIAQPYSVQGMKKIIDDARGVEDLLKKRHEEQQKAINRF